MRTIKLNPAYVISVVDNRVNAQDHGTRIVITTKSSYEVSQTLEEINALLEGAAVMA